MLLAECIMLFFCPPVSMMKDAMEPSIPGMCAFSLTKCQIISSNGSDEDGPDFKA